MQLRLALKGDLEKMMAQEKQIATRAVTTAMKRASSGLRNELRRQVKKAGLGQGLEKAWRSVIYPKKGRSMAAAGMVYSKAQRIHDAFAGASVVRAKEAEWLAIPLDAAKAANADYSYRRSKSSKAKRWSEIGQAADRAGGLAFIRLAPDKALLVRRLSTGKTVAFFYLVRRVQLPKLLDMDGPTRKWGDKLPGYIVKEMDKADRRAANRPK